MFPNSKTEVVLKPSGVDFVKKRPTCYECYLKKKEKKKKTWYKYAKYK